LWKVFLKVNCNCCKTFVKTIESEMAFAVSIARRSTGLQFMRVSLQLLIVYSEKNSLFLTIVREL